MPLAARPPPAASPRKPRPSTSPPKGLGPSCRAVGPVAAPPSGPNVHPPPPSRVATPPPAGPERRRPSRLGSLGPKPPEPHRARNSLGPLPGTTVRVLDAGYHVVAASSRRRTPPPSGPGPPKKQRATQPPPFKPSRLQCASDPPETAAGSLSWLARPNLGLNVGRPSPTSTSNPNGQTLPSWGVVSVPGQGFTGDLPSMYTLRVCHLFSLRH